MQTSLLCSFFQNKEALIYDASYVDDAAFLLMDELPSMLVCKAVAATSIIHVSCSQRGFKPKDGTGKSAVLLDLRGPGSPAAKETVYIDNEAKIVFDAEGNAINVVSQYPHLGKLQAANCNQSPELAHCGPEHH